MFNTNHESKRCHKGDVRQKTALMISFFSVTFDISYLIFMIVEVCAQLYVGRIRLPILVVWNIKFSARQFDRYPKLQSSRIF